MLEPQSVPVKYVPHMYKFRFYPSRSNHSDHYMVLYNGNAEVIGNFRALNFYKASDINIKEDIQLLTRSKSLIAVF